MEDCTVKVIRSMVDGAYYDDRLAVLEHFSEFSPARSSCRIRMFAIIVVKSGSIDMTVDGKEYSLGANDVFVVSPNAVVDSFNAGVTCSGMSLCMSAESVSMFTSSISNRADVPLRLSSWPLVHARKLVVDNMMGFFSILQRKFIDSRTTLNEEIIRDLVNASFCELVGEMSKDAVDYESGYTSADTLFRKFLKLLDSRKPRVRRVDEYAELLEISPKYLSTICRKKSGMTAIQVINKAVLSDAMEALRSDSKSIHDVAIELGFPNQSFFGTFMKKHTGLSPLQFRNRGNGKKKLSE